MITSLHNAKVQWVRTLQAQAKARRAEGVFVVEGVRLAEEALASGWQARLVLYSSELSGRGQQAALGFAARGAPIEETADHVLRAVSDTQNPQGLLVVLEQGHLPFPPSPTLALIPDEIRDPGNLGSMLRTAAAAGVDGALIPPGAADPYAPKVVRAAMGAHFRLPLQTASWEEIEAFLQRAGLPLYLAEAGGALPYTRANLAEPFALAVGGEAAGAGQAAHRLAAARLSIPMAGGVESLNAAAATAILLFEAARQRSVKGAA
ncbi:MAG: RNA methyltransferase [Chloroflexi bacterium]|nr:RNA methyltransferase [Chloroflexota bacterium]